MGLTSLAYHMDMDWLLDAHRRTRKDGAVGVDGQSGRDYEANLLVNLKHLLDRAKSGLYRAPAVRRAYIPKGDSTLRPLGIPTYEDKVLQREVAMLLEPVCEQDFLNFSYGFRPGRSAHGALQALWEGLTQMGDQAPRLFEDEVACLPHQPYVGGLEGRPLREVSGRLKRETLDVEVELDFRRRTYLGKRKGDAFLEVLCGRDAIVCGIPDHAGESHVD